MSTLLKAFFFFGIDYHPIDTLSRNYLGWVADLSTAGPSSLDSSLGDGISSK